MTSNPHMKTQFKNAYSSTGFDMLGVLVCIILSACSRLQRLTDTTRCG
jgi:hypothetical protein